MRLWLAPKASAELVWEKGLENVPKAGFREEYLVPFFF
jgi:hypothetical protein